MAQACRDAAAWTSARGRPLHINVNLSAPELQDPSVTGFLSALLGEYDVDPHRLIVEITESMLMVDTDTAATTLERLARLGVRVALDDFGTGFSSLAYLQRFPVDVVKIDKTFVDSLGGGSDEFPLAGAILALGRSLGLAVTAEGVEHGVQLARLRELRCERAQGFFLSEPLPAAAAQMFIRARAGAVPIGIAGTTP
jgi:EAL domain-containing protein (putative c-di-GMP-specific phosphodiesterase class I)